MKTLILAAALAFAATGAHAQYYGSTGTGSNSQSHGVNGFTRNNGTYVQPHEATNPNNTQRDNYGTRGNQNPYTGVYGTRTPKY